MPSAAPSAAAAARLLRTHLVFGANTDVGKTVVTAGLFRARLLKAASGAGRFRKSQGAMAGERPIDVDASLRSADKTAPASAASAATHYIKPLQCGGSDEGWVRRHVEIPSGGANETSFTPPPYSAATLYRWEMAASPHLASRVEKAPVSDEKIIKSLIDALTTMEDESIESKDEMTAQPSILVETAGGVLSPSSASPDNSLTTHARGVPSSDDGGGGSDPLSWGWSTQADLYQPLGLPVVLVGDGRLGGISCTLSALESLAVRGYDVQGIVVVDDGGGYGNVAALREYAASQASSHVRGQEFPFARQSYQVDPKESILSLPPLPPEPEPLTSWYQSKEVEEGLDAFEDRLEYLWNKERGREDQLLSQGYFTLPPV